MEFESVFDTPIPFSVLLLNTLEVSPHKDVASDRQLSADEGCAIEDPLDPKAVVTEVPKPEVDVEPEAFVAEEKRSHLELLRDKVLTPELATASNLCMDDLPAAGSGFSFPSGGSRVSNDSTSTSDVPLIGIPAEFIVNKLWCGRCGGGNGW